jgi:arsenate reductase-like glutaredoxin family protein
MKGWDLSNLILQDLKAEGISSSELDFLRARVNSYEELLNKRARLLREHTVSEGDTREDQIRDLILSHYSFLKRPIVVLGNQIFVGNSAKIVQSAKEALLIRK